MLDNIYLLFTKLKVLNCIFLKFIKAHNISDNFEIKINRLVLWCNG
jgi:hypothetical protein